MLKSITHAGKKLIHVDEYYPSWTRFVQFILGNMSTFLTSVLKHLYMANVVISFITVEFEIYDARESQSANTKWLCYLI